MGKDIKELLCDEVTKLVFPKFCEFSSDELGITIQGVFLAIIIAIPMLVLPLIHYIVFEFNILSFFSDALFLILIPYIIGWALSIFAYSRALRRVPELLKNVDEIVRHLNINIDEPIHVRFIRRTIHEHKFVLLFIILLIFISAYAWFFNYLLNGYLKILVDKPLVLISTIYSSLVVFPRTFIWTSRVAASIINGLIELKAIVEVLKQEIFKIMLRLKNDKYHEFHNVHMIVTHISKISVLFKDIVDFAVWGSFLWIIGLSIIIPTTCLALQDINVLYYGFLVAVVFYVVGILFHIVPKRIFNSFIKTVRRSIIINIKKYEENLVKMLINNNLPEKLFKDVMFSYIVLEYCRRQIIEKIPNVKPSFNKYYIISRIPIPIVLVLLSGLLKGVPIHEQVNFILEMFRELVDILL